MKRLLLTAVALLALASPSLAAQTYSCPIPGDAMEVYRLAWVDSGKFMRSGAVVVGGDHLAENAVGDRAAVQAAYRKLATKYKVGAVVNLRAESAEDAAAAKAVGMMYLYMPIPDGVAPNPAQVEKFFGFLAAARAKKKVVLWHCAGGIGRTGVLAAMLRIREGWSTEDAANEMFQMGLNYPQAVEHLPALNAFAAAHGKKTYYPANWPFGRTSPHDYRGIVKRLPTRL